MTIKSAMRQLGVKSEYALAKALGTSSQLVAFWRREKESVLPELWADRVKLRSMERA